jgi:hypothetical protein
MGVMIPAPKKVESALTGGDGKVLTDPPTFAVRAAGDRAGHSGPAAVLRTARGLDPIGGKS